MKARPILFMGAMVLAILDGRKTVTRRVGKTWAAVQPGDRLWVREAWRSWTEEHWDEGEDPHGDDDTYAKAEMVAYRSTPRQGLRRWLKRPPSSVPGFQDEPHRVTYLAESTPLDRNPNLHGPWRPSIHMPRWACRLELEVVSVTEQRGSRIAWEVDAEEAALEGFASAADFHAVWARMHADHTGPVYRIEFRRLP